MLAKYFYLIISSDESSTKVLISKNVLANNENVQSDKCGSEMNFYIHFGKGAKKGELQTKGMLNN